MSSIEPRTDVAKLLNLTGPASQVLLALFIVTQAALFATTIGDITNPVLGSIGLTLVLAAAVISTRTGPFPLTSRITRFTVTVVAASTALVSWQLSTTEWAGYASWHLGANTFLLLNLALRGRTGWAWIGMVIMAGITLAWTVSTGQSILAGVNLVDRQAGTLLIGTIFAIGLSRTARRIIEFNAAESRREREQAASQVATDERMRQAERLRNSVLPVLRTIASGDYVSPANREEYLILEATLRDSIRARSLTQQPLVSAAIEARRRGVDVHLLDDSQPNDRAADAVSEISAWVTDHLEQLKMGSFTARVLPLGRDAAASIVMVDDAGTRHVELRLEAPDRNHVSTIAHS